MKTYEVMGIITKLPEFKEVPNYKVVKHRYKKGNQISLDKLEKIFNKFGYVITWVKLT